MESGVFEGGFEGEGGGWLGVVALMSDVGCVFFPDQGGEFGFVGVVMFVGDESERFVVRVGGRMFWWGVVVFDCLGVIAVGLGSGVSWENGRFSCLGHGDGVVCWLCWTCVWIGAGEMVRVGSVCCCLCWVGGDCEF